MQVYRKRFSFQRKGINSSLQYSMSIDSCAGSALSRSSARGPPEWQEGTFGSLAAPPALVPLPSFAASGGKPPSIRPTLL